MKKIVVISIILVLLLPLVSAFSLSPGTNRIYFEPGLQKTVSFKVVNTAKITKEFELIPSAKSDALSGILDQVVNIEEGKTKIKGGEEHKFYVDIVLPDTLEYGIHDIHINIFGEGPNKKKGMINVRTILAFKIRVYSLFPGKYVETKLLNPSAVNIGESIDFTTTARNIGTENIENIRSKIEIYKENNLVGSVYSDYVSVASKEIEELSASLFITEGYEIGEYSAKAFVEYDGKKEKVEPERRFNVGELSIDTINITSNNFAKDKINKFDIVVESKWNRPSDVYADVVLTDFMGNEKSKFKTQTVNVAGWKREVVPAYFDTKDIENDNYVLNVVLNYAEKTSKKVFAVRVTDKGDSETVEEMPGPKGSLLLISLAVIIGLLVIMVLIMFFRGKNLENSQYET